MQFTKMHGIGNDYVYVDCGDWRPADPPALARAVSDRHRGIGSDGLILICPSQKADVRMEMYNADGSRAEMCGNGIRCVAKYAYDHGLAKKNPLAVETDRGVLSLDLTLRDDRVVAARVDMGTPILAGEQIPTTFRRDRVVNQRMQFGTLKLEGTCVSMGNPHVVFFTDDVAGVALAAYGPRIEVADYFPQRTNVHFVQVHSRGEVTMRTWERGSGITLACGTGAAAVCVAGVLTGQTDRRITAHLPGGDLELDWPEPDASVYMTGPAEEVFTGHWPPPDDP